MGYGSYIRNNEVHEWSDFYVKYARMSRHIGKSSFRRLIGLEIEKVDKFYGLLERKAVDEKQKILGEVERDISRELFEETDKIGRNVVYGGIGRESLVATDESERNEDEFVSNTDWKCETETETRQLGVMRFITMPGAFRRRKKEKHITELLHSLLKIKSYREINNTGLHKLIKKHKNSTKGREDCSEMLKRAHFHVSRTTEQVRAAIKSIYKALFAKNNPKQARRLFKRLRRGLISSDILYVVAGFLSGVNSVLAAHRFPNGPFFAANNVFLGFILFGLCMKFFKFSKINYKFIFNFDYSSTMSNGRYLLLVSAMNTLYVAFSHAVGASLGHLAFLGFCFMFLTMPLNICFASSRYYLLSAVGRAIFKPLSTIRFRHFYFVDVIQSFSFSITRLMTAAGCSNRAIQATVVGVFPLVRILQCFKRFSGSRLVFPHIFNALKYLMAIYVLVLRTIHGYAEKKAAESVATACFILVGSLYAFIWDVFVDFSIVRSKFMFSRVFYAYFILFDFVARFSWIVEFFELVHEADRPQLALLIVLAEIVRRFIWTVVRVEVEHLNNCDELRANKVLQLTSGELFYKRDQEQKNKIDDESSQQSTVTLNTESTYETSYDTANEE
ncbi:PHO1 [Enterospora canceri]|uniref:PHO1 n=1 Tax=Enterospora canceri TaxID=1081671 RepID=A0A1Y1S6T6_9MICR|nr:PHO1 [Enterospora canceri]